MRSLIVMLLKRAKQNSFAAGGIIMCGQEISLRGVLSWQRTREGKLDSLPNFSRLRHQKTTALAH